MINKCLSGNPPWKQGRSARRERARVVHRSAAASGKRELRKGSPRWRGLRDGNPIRVVCFGHGAVGLCREHEVRVGDDVEVRSCLEEFRAVLTDVPRLLDDLDVAMAGEVRFVEHGSSSDVPGGPGGHPAASAYQRIAGALGLVAGWFDARRPEQLAGLLLRVLDLVADEPIMGRLASELSSAAARAHRVIDAPPSLFFYGACPECGADIWHERIRPDDDEGKVRCPCGYERSADAHIREQLDDDRMMTVSELVSAITMAGEAVTRHQINGWIRREGLPRERANRPRWKDGQLVACEVDVYRLGDVRDLAVRAEVRRSQRVVAPEG